jgi:hypothetical protein
MGGQAVSLALAAPHWAPLHPAIVPTKGKDGSPATRLLMAIFKQSGIFKFSCDDKAVPTPPLAAESGREARPVGFARKGEQPMSDEWKKSLPFPAHWLSYLSFKLVVLALAALVALRLSGVF